MKLTGKRVLTYVDDVYEDLELWVPYYRLIEEGAEVVIAGPERRTFDGKHGYPCSPDALIDETDHTRFDLLLLPGGFAPDKLRRLPRVLEAVRWFHAQRRPIAFICHAGWIPVSAGVMKGVRCTSTPGIKDDMINAGAEWIDEPCVIDGHFVSARRPPDIPAFCRGILKAMGA